MQRATPAGRFSITGLPAGYSVIAVDRLPDDDAWQDPGFLALTSRATRIALVDGQERTLTLRSK
jgi:hypothetical protein